MKKMCGVAEVRWKDVIRAARAPKVHRTTAKKAFHRENIPVAARRPREKPNRSKANKAERVQIGNIGGTTGQLLRGEVRPHHR